jgi:vacuolar-type H+-ATPase subunit E/Vma4
MTTNQDSTEKIREEILADARRESEEIILRAKKDSETSLNCTVTDADRLRKERLEQARVEASRRSELILATVSVETGRLRAARMEALLESVREEARQQLLACESINYRDTVIILATDAINQMASDAFIVKLPEADQADLSDGLAEEIERRVGRSVRINIMYEEDITGRGVIVEDVEAHQVWDNRLLNRLERLWPALRQRIAMEVSFVPKMAPGGGT